MRQLQDWRNAGLVLPGRLAINISSQEIETEHFVDRFQLNVAEAMTLELELTEYSLVNSRANTLNTLHILRERHLSFAIDDFGTGYSSLSYLTRLPVQKLKIDAAFVQNLLANEQDQAIVKTIIAMAQSLGLQVIAEGIESLEQSDMLKAMGCGQGQGYHYGYPEPAEQFAQRLPRSH